ncbi:DUF4097 family beta strand repeat-containing protein [Aeromicrobium sp. CTD01-1L150]|uniref:DUF4097 family beta strand repeat-containing protein n=1 Tax=Aeromicrobium sp. CTD01-1L150 TaxID=3341830 RepID=UPI0035BFD673
MTYDDSSALDDFADDLEELEERSPLARTLITVAGTVAIVALVMGAVLGVSMLMKGTETATSRLDAGQLPQVALRSGDAAITVVEGDGDDITVTATVTSGLLGTDYELRRRDSEFEIVSGCFTLVNPGCGVQVEIEVPAGLPVEVTTESGDVVAHGMSERILTVVSGSGDVAADDLAVDELSATTNSGDVTATFRDDPFAVKAVTDSGDIDVTLPAEGQEYQVDMQSSSGLVQQDLEPSDDATAFIRLHSESGDVELARN